MTPEKEAELFAKLDLMLELYRRLEEDVRDVRAEMRAEMSDMRAEMRDMRTDMKTMSEGIHAVADRVSRVEGRIEEQSKFLQLVLAGRQTRKSAA